jgi:hypothetical protein
MVMISVLDVESLLEELFLVIDVPQIAVGVAKAHLLLPTNAIFAALFDGKKGEKSMRTHWNSRC